MALVKCKECGREISGDAQECPGCGFVPERRAAASPFASYSIMVFAAWMVAVVVFFASVPHEPLSSGVPFVRMSVYMAMVGPFLKVAALIGTALAAVSVAKREPRRVLAFVALVLNASGMLG